MQSELLGDRQDRIAGAVFPAVENLECLRIVSGNDAFAKSELKDFELLQRATDDPPVLGMLHLAVFAKRGAQDTHRALAGGLDFEMQIAMRCLHGLV